MCVLVVADKRRPTEEEIEKMDAANPDGNGIAWREVVKGEKIVKWEKGLGLDDIKTLSEKVPMPYVLHFRIASCGGKHKELTHPFPVEKEMRRDLSGMIRGMVLFHNGHWHPYKDKGIDGAIKNKVKVPDGKWSDTRVMAWLAHLHGPNILELIDEKVILFGPDKIEIFHPEGWARVSDLLVSNRSWEHTYVRKAGFVKNDKDDENWDYMHDPTKAQSMKCYTPSCHRDRVPPSYYCADHQGSCKQVHCFAIRVAGTEFCKNHQPLCSEALCDNPREFGEKLCLKHLSLKAIKEPGKSPVPFRQGPQMVSRGNDNQEGSGRDGKILDGVVAGGTSTADDPIAQAELSWACSLNPKPVKTPNIFNRMGAELAKLTHNTVM